ncbi:phage tail length tape measure family protein [Hansschlegelia sp.]|uniref:phage tail length tape measure family protein n=1 Tax=Hansschlegelia sp. TaxID=2041892 RepID=UPI002B95D742|nr:phage tail length tape measure family protein [Hansschlegelia sp.]HVI28865.1 phage tail length tape measure family protein [Hansschlegelia sp.]
MVSVAEVREIDIRYKATGVSETVDLLNRLIRAEEGVVVVGEKVERSDASLSRGLETLKGRYLEHYKVIQQTTRDINLLHEARARDLISVNQYQAALGAMQAKLSALPSELKRVQQAQGEVARGWSGMAAPTTGAYATMQANIKAVETHIAAQQRAEERLRGLGQPVRSSSASNVIPFQRKPGQLSSSGLSNLSFQANDIATMAIMGANPTQIIASQAGQIFQIFQQEGAKPKAVFEQLASAAAKAISPIGLVVAGLGAAGIAAAIFYSRTKSEAELFDEAIEKHAAAIKLIRDAWGEAAQGVEEYAKPTAIRGATELQASRLRLEAAALSKGKSASSGLFSKAIDMTGEELLAINPIFEPIRKDVDAFQKTVEKGRPDFTRLLDAVDSLYMARRGDSMVSKLREEVKKLADEGDKAQRALKALAEIPFNTGFDAAIGALPKAPTQLPAIGDYLGPRVRAAQEAEFAMRDVAARTAAERAGIAADRARAEARRDPKTAGDADAAAARASALVMAQARREAADYASQQEESRRRQIEGAQTELRAIGATAAETDKLRRLIELTNEARQHAYDLGKKYDDAELSGLEREADAWAKLQQAIREAEAAKRAVDETKLLRFGPDERAIRGQFETDDAGEIISAKDRMTAAQLRYNRAVQDAQEAERGLGKELIDAARKGDWKAMLTAPLERVGDYFTKQIGDRFDDAMGGLIAQSFGAPPMSSADVRAMSTAAMTVTAGTVTITGGGASLLSPTSFDKAGGALSGGAPRAAANDVLAPKSIARTPALAPHADVLGDAMSFVGNYKRGVDPRLTEILSEAARRSGYRVEAFSGFRPGDPRFHGRGMATDIRLVDPATGKALPSYQSAANFRPYEQFAQTARQVQMERYPGLERDFRWGGYFSGPQGKYGAVDLMHFDLGGRRVGMGGGSWNGGMTAAQRRMWPGAQSFGMGANDNGVTALPEIKVEGLQQSFNTLQQSTASLAQNAIPQATQGLGGLGQQAQGLGGIFQSLLSGLGGGAPGGGGGNIFTSLLSGLFGGAFAGGTENLPANKINLVGEEGPELLIGNKVIPHRRSMQMIARPAQILQPVYAPEPRSGGETKMEVHVHNAPPGTRVEESTDAKGNRRADVIFDEMQARNMSNPKSRTGRAVSSTFGSQAVQRKYG